MATPVVAAGAGVTAEGAAAPAAVAGQSMFLLLIKPINTIITTVNAIPQSIYTKSIEASRSIAAKLQEYADAMSGKGGSKSTDTRSVMIEKEHRKFLDKLRNTDMPAYRRLLTLVDTLASQPLDVQQAMLKAQFGPTSTTATTTTTAADEGTGGAQT